MFLELIAILAAGFGLAGIALTLNFIVGKRLPKWIFPASAGAGMLLMAIWLEYSWLERTTASFPEGVEVASTNQVRSWYRPWTYVVPLTTRLVAIDTRFNRRHDEAPGHVLSQVLLAGRWEPTRQFSAVFDCVGHRRADLVEGAVLGEDGGIENARWVRLQADDALMHAACGH
ncbi:MAG: hypothetical protein GX538_05640 [Gammaproteobacteria bacterium]|nr:hypothetical protein [Gammaproteobacteria bacterium]